MDYTGKFVFTSQDFFSFKVEAANLTDDPFASPVFKLRRLLGV